MVETQFFTRKNSWLDDYKNNFKKALEKARIINFFSVEVLDFLMHWLEKQNSYIPRNDVDNFLPNMQLIFKDKNFYDFALKKLKNIKNNWNILEYSFNLISALDDSKIEFENSEKERIKKENLKNSESKARQKDHQDIKQIEELLKKY